MEFGIVRVPAAGAETDLAEHLAVAERFCREGVGGRDEIVEAAVVPDRNERVPDLLEPRHVALADRLLQAGEACALFQRLRSSPSAISRKIGGRSAGFSA